MAFKDKGRIRRGVGSSGNPKDCPWLAAEKRVARLLARLIADGCLVLNDVPFPYGNLDHLVIRPDGTVFELETKAHRGTVTWDGKRLLIDKRPFTRNPISQVHRSIRWLRQMAKRLFGHNPWIVAILVFPNAQVLIRQPVKRISVLNAKDILTFIRAYRR